MSVLAFDRVRLDNSRPFYVLALSINESLITKWNETSGGHLRTRSYSNCLSLSITSVQPHFAHCGSSSSLVYSNDSDFALVKLARSHPSEPVSCPILLSMITSYRASGLPLVELQRLCRGTRMSWDIVGEKWRRWTRPFSATRVLHHRIGCRVVRGPNFRTHH